MSIPERPACNGISEAERHLRDAGVVKIEPILAGAGYWGRAEAEFANALAHESNPERRQELSQRVEQLAYDLQGLVRDDREEILLREIQQWKKGIKSHGAQKRAHGAFPHRFPAFLSPVLRVLADGSYRSVEEIRQRVAAELRLTAQDLELRHDSIHQSVFVNKVAHALSRLVVHRNIVAGRKGQQIYRITPHGLDTFRAHPTDARVQDL